MKKIRGFKFIGYQNTYKKAVWSKVLADVTPLYQCTKCETTYPLIEDNVMCNGKILNKCICANRKEYI